LNPVIESGKIESGNLEIEKNCGNSFSVDRKKL
jgi:hypothetical protein